MSISVSPQEKRRKGAGPRRCAFSSISSLLICVHLERVSRVRDLRPCLPRYLCLFISPLNLSCAVTCDCGCRFWRCSMKRILLCRPLLLISSNDGVGEQTASCTLVLHFNRCQCQNYWHPFTFFQKKKKKPAQSASCPHAYVKKSNL